MFKQKTYICGNPSAKGLQPRWQNVDTGKVVAIFYPFIPPYHSTIPTIHPTTTPMSLLVDTGNRWRPLLPYHHPHPHPSPSLSPLTTSDFFPQRTSLSRRSRVIDTQLSQNASLSSRPSLSGLLHVTSLCDEGRGDRGEGAGSRVGPRTDDLARDEAAIRRSAVQWLHWTRSEEA